MEYEIYATDELTHHGIKGMRWGIRRYQRKDGSLTKAGERRYNREMAKLKKEADIVKKRKATQAKFDKLDAKRRSLEEEKRILDEAEGKNIGKRKGSKGDKVDAKVKETKKSANDMSDIELVEAINRARLEDTYRSLRPEAVVKPKFMERFWKEAAQPALINSGKKFLENAITKAGENLLKGKVDPNSLEALNLLRDKAKAKYEAADYENKFKKAKNGESDDGLPPIKTWDDVIKSAQYHADQARKRAGNQASESSEQPTENSPKNDSSNSGKAVPAKKEAEKAEKAAKKEAEKAEKAAKKEAERAEKANEKARKDNEQRSWQEYERTFNTPVSKYTTDKNVSSGMKYLEGPMDEIIDKDGTVLLRFR